jgi:hypothetical protein
LIPRTNFLQSHGWARDWDALISILDGRIAIHYMIDV